MKNYYTIFTILLRIQSNTVITWSRIALYGPQQVCNKAGAQIIFGLSSLSVQLLTMHYSNIEALQFYITIISIFMWG